MTISDISKAIGALLVGALGWGAAVVTSSSSAITSSEWIQLATVGVTVITVYILKNGPTPDPPL